MISRNNFNLHIKCPASSLKGSCWNSTVLKHLLPEFSLIQIIFLINVLTCPLRLDLSCSFWKCCDPTLSVEASPCIIVPAEIAECFYHHQLLCYLRPVCTHHLRTSHTQVLSRFALWKVRVATKAKGKNGREKNSVSAASLVLLTLTVTSLLLSFLPEMKEATLL